MQFPKNFALTSVSGTIPQVTANPLGPLSDLPGVWKGPGFNQIWRPFHGTQDRFLELNETIERLEFEVIPGDIPNRGLLQADINLHGIRYLQTIVDANVKDEDGNLAGIHVEPGLWVTVPRTLNPAEPETVARLANIPHGTSLVAQGTALGTIDRAPPITPASITPFLIGKPGQQVNFPESNLGIPTTFRTDPKDIPNVTQALVNNPNLALTQALGPQNVVSTTTLRVSTTPLNPPATGGGASNIAFLEGASGGPNARVSRMDAIFWIETVRDPAGKTFLQLQYTQTVLLDFNGLSWPHVSVATLVKQ